MPTIFLDHQSSTPVLAEVFEAMQPYFRERFGSPASLHQHGLRARDALEKARTQVASFLNAEFPEEIIFTSGGTEAVNLAIKGVAYANQARGNHIVHSAIDHPAVFGSIEFLEKQGFTATRVRTDDQGRLNPTDVRAAITDRTILVCVQHANHDIGTIEPIAEIATISNERGIALFVDATYSAGWLPLDVRASGAQLVALSPHRFYGPKGAGVLYRHRKVRLANLIHGGVQEGGRRAGTENVPAIVGAGIAAEIARRELPNREAHTRQLQQRLWSALRERVDYLQLHGPPPGPERITTNLNISPEFLEGEAVLLRLDMRGVAVATGTSCVSKALKVSPVLAALGVDHTLAQASVILSLGQENTVEEIDHVVEVFASTVQILREMSPLWDDFQQGLTDSVIRPKARGATEGQRL